MQHERPGGDLPNVQEQRNPRVAKTIHDGRDRQIGPEPTEEPDEQDTEQVATNFLREPARTIQRTMLGPRILAQGVVKMLSSGALMALFLGFERVEIGWFLLGIAAGQGAYVWVLAAGSKEHTGR